MSTNRTDAAEAYSTLNAPYLQYLKAIERGWQEAEVLARHLEKAAGFLPTITDESILEGESTPIAQIIDISVSPDGERNTRNTAKVTANLGRHLIRPVPGEVGTFFQKLRSSKPDVQTRIVVLHRQWGCTDKDQAADTLLFCHILGMELDLRPSDVTVLARILDLKDEVVSPRRHPQLSGYVSFGSMDDCQSNSVAAWLGILDFNGGLANLGKAFDLRTRWIIADLLQWWCVHKSAAFPGMPPCILIPTSSGSHRCRLCGTWTRREDPDLLPKKTEHLSAHSTIACNRYLICRLAHQTGPGWPL